MADLIAEVANFAVPGEHFSDRFRGKDGMRYRNHIRWSLSGKTVDLYQHRIIWRPFSEIEQEFVHTTTVVVRDVHSSRIKGAEQIVNDLAVLLSFACLSEVRPFAFRHGSSARTFSTSGLLMRSRAPIEQDGAALRSFIEQVWPGFRRLKASRQLHVVVDYLTKGVHPLQPLEVRLLLAFVTLENLKATWARSKKIPFHKNFFRRPNARGTVNSKSYRFTFEELVVR